MNNEIPAPLGLERVKGEAWPTWSGVVEGIGVQVAFNPSTQRWVAEAKRFNRGAVDCLSLGHGDSGDEALTAALAKLAARQ